MRIVELRAYLKKIIVRITNVNNGVYICFKFEVLKNLNLRIVR